MSIISINNKFSSVTASGEKRTANKSEGRFVGKIVGYVPIKNADYPTMKGKIQIKVDGQDALFEDVININDTETLEKYQDSLGFFQQHTKEAMIAAGKSADYNQDVDADWCDAELTKLAEEKAEVKFKREEETGKNGKKSLKIHYLK